MELGTNRADAASARYAEHPVLYQTAGNGQRSYGRRIAGNTQQYGAALSRKAA